MATESAPLDERYFTWLYGMIGTVSTKNPASNHWKLARQLYSTEFEFFIPNDDNRAEDGRQLRDEFLDLSPFEEWEEAEDWLLLPCSFLEMLIALARKVAFETYACDGEDETGEWFWKILDNLKLSQWTDRKYNFKVGVSVALALEAVNRRTYNYNGVGGLFPLRLAREDQREVEIWYQLAAYLDELPS